MRQGNKSADWYIREGLEFLEKKLWPERKHICWLAYDFFKVFADTCTNYRLYSTSSGAGWRRNWTGPLSKPIAEGTRPCTKTRNKRTSLFPNSQHPRQASKCFVIRRWHLGSSPPTQTCHNLPQEGPRPLKGSSPILSWCTVGQGKLLVSWRLTLGLIVVL